MRPAPQSPLVVEETEESLAKLRDTGELRGQKNGENSPFPSWGLQTSNGDRSLILGHGSVSVPWLSHVDSSIKVALLETRPSPSEGRERQPSGHRKGRGEGSLSQDSSLSSKPYKRRLLIKQVIEPRGRRKRD